MSKRETPRARAAYKARAAMGRGRSLRKLRRHLSTLTGFGAFVALTVSLALAEEVEFDEGLSAREAAAVYSALKKDLIDAYAYFLEENLPYISDGDAHFQIRYETDFRAATIVLSEDQEPAVFVYVGLWGFCGSGGCTTYILLKENGRWRKIGRSFACTLKVLNTRTKGMRDILESCEKYSKRHYMLKYDGQKYVGGSFELD